MESEASPTRRAGRRCDQQLSAPPKGPQSLEVCQIQSGHEYHTVGSAEPPQRTGFEPPRLGRRYQVGGDSEALYGPSSVAPQTRHTGIHAKPHCGQIPVSKCPH